MSDSNKKVLIADDNQVSFAYLEVLLKRMGIASIRAKNGLEVLKLIKNEHPDIILLDIGMETMDGITVLEAVKKDTRTSHIPVIMVSGDDSKETINKCKRLGCVWYLAKPVNADKLSEALKMTNGT